MKTKLIILIAIICCAFAADSKAQTCPTFYIKNSTPCPINYTLVWDCGGGSFTYVNNTVGGGTANIEANPGTWPHCCRFAKIGIEDCNGNVITLDPSNPSATICDCTGAMVNIDLIWNGSNWDGVWIH